MTVLRLESSLLAPPRCLHTYGRPDPQPSVLPVAAYRRVLAIVPKRWRHVRRRQPTDGCPRGPLQPVPSTELARLNQIAVAEHEELAELVAGQAGTATRPRAALFVGTRQWLEHYYRGFGGSARRIGIQIGIDLSPPVP